LPRKKQLPIFPYDFINEKADEYENSKWMERNQKRATELAIHYLFDAKLTNENENDPHFTDSLLILDIGCGTGFSTEVLMNNGFKVIGIDILPDMLLKARLKNVNMDLILADINYLPMRHNIADHLISISSYNFIIHDKDQNQERIKLLNSTARSLHNILRNKGRIVIEFYPKDERELKMFNESFINNGFEGFVVKNKPNQKSGQTFLLLRKRVGNGNM
jgi:SAM-dependent methyltransferase